MATRKRKSSANLWLFYGTDQAGVKAAAASQAQALAPQEALNTETIDGWADDVDGALRSIAAVREAILTLPFFGQGKLVWWKNVSFLADTVQGRSKQVLEALEALVPDLERLAAATDVTLLVSAQGLDGRRRFAKWLLEHAETRELNVPEQPRGGGDQVVDWVEGQAREKGVELVPEAVEWLALVAASDSMLLASELEKLATYAGASKEPEPLSLEEVRSLVHGQPQVALWDFADAVLAGDVRQALGRLEQLLSRGESEIGILAILAQQVRLAALAAVLRENRMLQLVSRGRFTAAELAPGAENYLPRKKSGEFVSQFQLSRVARLSVHQPSRHWIRAVNLLHQVWNEMLSGAVEKSSALEWAVISLMAPEVAGRPTAKTQPATR